MSEVISTTFQADSDDFNAEVKKAQAVIDGLTGKSLPLMEKNMNDAFFAAQKTAQGMNAMAKSAGMSGHGMLQLAQFADDAQYGIKGVMNNIPGLVQGLGAGAGVAGAISLLVLVAAKAGPLLTKLYSSADTEAAIAAAKAYGEALKENLRAIQLTVAEKERDAAISKSQDSFRGQVARDTITSPAITAAKAELDLLQKKYEMESQIAAARAKAEAAAAKANGGDPAAVEAAAANAAAAAAQAKLQAEIALQQKISRLQTEEMNRLQVLAENAATFFTGAAAQLDAEINRLQQNIAFAEANVEQAKKEAEDKDLSGHARRNAQDNLRAAEAKLAAEKEALALAKAQAEAAAANAATAKEQYDAAQKAASQAATDAAAKAKALEDQKKTAAEIAALAEQERAAAEKTAAAEKAKTEAAKAAAEEKRAAAEAERKAAEAKSQKDSLKDIQAEVLAMRAQAAGQKDQAAAIRANIKIAQEARQIAAATGMSEKQALEIAKEKARLQSQIDGQKTKAGAEARDGRIRLFRAGESPSTLQRGAAGTMLRSEAFTRRTQSWMENPLRTKSTMDQTAQDQLKTQQRLLQIWEKNLGLI